MPASYFTPPPLSPSQHVAVATKGRLADALCSDLAGLPRPQHPPAVCAGALHRGPAPAGGLPQAGRVAACMAATSGPGPHHPPEGKAWDKLKAHGGCGTLLYLGLSVKKMWLTQKLAKAIKRM